MKIKLGHKLLALLLLSSVLPLIVVSVLLINIGRTQVETTVDQVHRLEAHAAATRLREYLDRAEQRLAADFESAIDDLTDQEIATWLVYVLGKQDNVFTFRQIAVHDSLGERVGQPVRLPAEHIPEEHWSRFLVQADDVTEFTRQVPLAEAVRDRQTRRSPTYVNRARRESLIAVAVPITDPLGQLKWIVAGEISLRPVQRIVADVTLGSAGHAYLVDGEGRAVAHPRFDQVLQRRSLTGNGIVEQALKAGREGTVAFRDDEGQAQLGAHAPVLYEDWQLLVQQPAKDAYQPVRAMRARAFFVLLVALTAALASGLLHVRGITGPLREVLEGMRRIVDGQFSHRLDVRGPVETAELARAFNFMGRTIERDKQEIETWNRELQERVESKTRALQQAQDQLIQSAKMSSVGQLGAGVAHELNNPLAGIVGQAALLMRRLKKAPMDEVEREKLLGYLEHVQTESARCREIIHGLLSFSQATSGGTELLHLNGSLEKLLLLVANNTRSQGVELVAELEEDLPPIEANEGQIQQVMMHLVSNALQAMPDQGTLRIRTRAIDGAVNIEVSDTGRGIAAEHLDRIFEPFFTTKEVWESTGLGLSVCYSIVESHGGRIEVESELNRGSTFTIVLPVHSSRNERQAPEGAEPVGLVRKREAPATA